MAVEVSNGFKSMCKTNVPSGALGRITVLEEDPENNVEITENTDIQSIEIEDDCYVNDKFIGTAVAKKVKVKLFNDDNVYDLEDKEIKVDLGFELNNTEEVVTFGDFIIEKPNTEEVQAKTDFVGYDYMIKFNKTYVDNNTYPIALGTFLSNLCTQVGVILGSTTFVNSNYMVQGNPFTNGEDCKTVLSAVAQIAGGIAKIGRDNKLYIINLSKTTNLEEIDGNNYDTFIPNKVFGPINKLIIKMNSGVDGEESVRSDFESIDENGECAITISDNPILNSHEQREMVIDNIFNAIKGITYLPFKTTYYGYPHVDSTDKINILNVNDTEHDSYIFNHTIKYDGAFEGSIETPALTKTQSAYKNTSDLRTKFKRTELAVDKINGQITSIIEQQEGTYSQMNSITQDLNSTVDRIAQMESETNSTIEELRRDITGVTNTIIENGGNNLFYYDKEFWTTDIVTRTVRRNIQVGDDLSGKKIYLSFPTTEPLSVIEIASNYIITCSNGAITHEGVEEGGSSTERVSVTQNTVEIDRIYSMRNGNYLDGETEYTLPSDFGTVTTINSSSEIYQYIEIEETVTEEPFNLEEISGGEFAINTVSGRGYLIGEGNSKQNTTNTGVAVPNGKYTVSFKYKKIGAGIANASVKINGEEIALTQTTWTDITKTIDVNSNYIEIEFIGDQDNVLYVADLMGNAGEEAQIWTQNPNETRTDTVKIGKGIEVSSTIDDTKLKANADGVRIVQASNENNIVARFTKDGTETKDLKVSGKAQIAGLLIQQVGNQTWISSLL